MKGRRMAMTLATAALPAALGGIAPAAQDRFAVTVPDGLSLAEFRGYETWQYVAVSATEEGLKVIAANPAMIEAYRAGVPGSGRPFPEGSMVAKIEWSRQASAESPYAVTVPGVLKSVSFIEKDTKRFPATAGWAYAQYAYDAAADSFRPSVTGTACGHACHTAVAAKDYIFTAYPMR
ncbi:cytochrome P460 family protein [Paracraurococcus lichenis]|uniref:Cytochrome P460 family protein n=1 Tax=Paracraurococcus lichenis TaxID=3064888 RepID=A0ABT9E2Y2_9PROT|nr:cytochrome P460 family protein [Paracraurococcus sp. LOR1-02]MDO9710506.1 cytochrome P460 family protein [Paracraurococcus sp. LOR1-02]